MAESRPAPHLDESCLVFHPQAVLFIGALGAVARHVHAAPALLVGLGGPVQVDDGCGPLAAEALWVPPGWAHEVQGFERTVAVLYLEPGSAWAQGLRRQQPAGQAAALGEPAAWRQAMAACQAQPQPARLAEVLTPRLGPAQSAGGDARVQRALAQLRQPHEAAPAGLARVEALSDSRLRHLFTQDAGVAMRRYRVWRRLMQAARHALAGLSLTEAAAAAGFADQAHFTRAFRDMFGLPPSAVLCRPALRWTAEVATPP